MASSVISRGQSEVSDDHETNSKFRKGTAASDDSLRSSRRYRSSIASYGQRRKPHPLLIGPNPGFRRDYAAKYRAIQNPPRANLSEINQRVMSAKQLKVKQLQNELSETQLRLSELINENRLLKSLQKRQEGALKKYEGNKAELPQLIRTHNEDLRILKTNNKQLKTQLRETSTKLKERENEIDNLKENNTKLKKLIDDKNLLERDELQKKLVDSQKIINEQEDKIQMLSRKMLLEAKNSKHQLNLEVGKHRDTQRELHSALSTISRLEGQLLAREKVLLQPAPVPKGLPKLKTSKSTNKHENATITEEEEEGKKAPANVLEELKTETSAGLLSSLNTTEENPILNDEIFLEKLMKAETMPDERRKPSMFPNTTLNSKRTINSASKLSVVQIKGDPFIEAELTRKKLTESLADNVAKKDAQDPLNPINKNRINTLYEEIRNNFNKMEQDLDESLKRVKEDSEHKTLKEKLKSKETITQPNKSLESARNLIKRKLDDNLEVILTADEKNKTNKGLSLKDISRLKKELSDKEEQKLQKMNNTWNQIKDKVREEREKAEEAMKHLIGEQSEESSSPKSCSDHSLKDQPENVEDDVEVSTKEIDNGEQNRLHIPGYRNVTLNDQLKKLTDDKHIHEELRKADNLFKELKTESQRTRKKPNIAINSTKPPTDQERSLLENISEKETVEGSEIKSKMNFRTASFQSSDALNNFQTEHQKQNLLKALKAIDVGKDPDGSSDESGDQFGFDKSNKIVSKKDIPTKVSVNTKSKSELMKELFGK